jgi:hypothetical protein
MFLGTNITEAHTTEKSVQAARLPRESEKRA